MIAVRLSLLLLREDSGPRNSQLRHLPCVSSASSRSMLKRFPPELRSNKSDGFYCFLKGALK